MNDNGNDDDRDLVELKALEIVFTYVPSSKIQDETMEPERHNFVISEIGHNTEEELDEDGTSILVTFDSSISADKVIDRLKQVIANIKRYGLPQRTLSLPRKLAAEFINHNETEETLLLLEIFFPLNKAKLKTARLPTQRETDMTSKDATKFSEKRHLQYCGTIPNWRLDWIRKDLDPEEYNKIFNFYKELYEAAMAHPDWGSDGEQAYCVKQHSPQNTPRKLLRWSRARSGRPTTPETQNEK